MALEGKGGKHGTTRSVNICVVGLSGVDQDERTLHGVGKSCLCNRFVRPAQDDYYQDHSSIYSTSDFGGSVINNDHFLYWGSVSKQTEDGNHITFHVVEETEFIDDSSFMPLSQKGQPAPYIKRCTNTKLSSPGKLMYISRDQVALQADYEQVGMPHRDGKFHVDGFICVYDVGISLAQRNDKVSLQEDILSSIISGIGKTKKPAIVVATKCDESDEGLLSQAHKFVHSKKLTTPLIEVSAQENLNVELGFTILAQMIENKGRFRSKLVHYHEAYETKKEMLQKAFEKYQALVKSIASDLSTLMTWRTFKQTHQSSEDFSRYVTLAGSRQAERIFNQQASKLKQHFEEKKLNEYLSQLPEALDEFLPSLLSIEGNEWKWERCLQGIKNHKSFDKWFRILPQGVPWNDREEILSTTDSRIPYDVLHLERSRACFDRHVKKLMESARKIRMKSEFRKLLELTPRIKPGTSWGDAWQWLQYEEPYKYLDEHDRKVIFEKYLQDITLTAKLEFQELLFESASKFMQLDQNVRPSDAEMKEIYCHLHEDERYKILENVGNARDILLFNHIALMQSPTRCLSGPDKCMDRLMQEVVEITGHRPLFNPYENDLLMDVDDEQIGIVVLGTDGLALELENKIKLQSSSSDSLEYIVDGQIYALDLKVIDDNEVQSQSDLVESIVEFRPQGYLAIFSDEASLNYLKKVLRTIHEVDGGQTDSFLNLPMILVLASDSAREDNINFLRRDGQDLADQLQCLFVDYPFTLSNLDGRIHESQVQDAIRGIVDVIKKRSRPPSTPSFLPEACPDLRILLCAMCGDEYPVELILGPLLHHQSCYCNSDRPDTVMLETYVGTTKKTVSITLSSYHRAHSLKNELFHGFILVYSATRKASLETLSAFANTLPQIPIQVLAVTGSASGASVVFHNETASTLLAGGTNLANKLSAKFQTTSPLFQHHTGAFAAFFTTAYEKRHETEFIVRGIKRRRQDPLPEVPKEFQPADLIPNGSVPDESNYATIPGRPRTDASPYAIVPPPSIKSESDSAPSSPNRIPLNPSFNHYNEVRSRSSTQDTPESVRDDDSESLALEIPHDETGLYAQVIKHIKEKRRSELMENDSLNLTASDFEDDIEMMWCDNVAYDTGLNRSAERPGNSLAAAANDNRQYNTVPYSRGSKLPAASSKYATIGATSKIHEYAEIDQMRTVFTKRQSQNSSTAPLQDGYEPDSLSSLSSKSKDSLGSQGDEPHLLGLQRKIELFNKINSGRLSPKESPSGQRKDLNQKDRFYNSVGPDKMWTGKEEDTKENMKAPLAEEEDPETNIGKVRRDTDSDIQKVRELLQEKLIIRKPENHDGQGTCDTTEMEKSQDGAKSSDSGDLLNPQGRPRSRSGSRSSDYHLNLTKSIRKLVGRISPAPSPTHSENEHSGEKDQGPEKTGTLRRKLKMRKSKRDRGRSRSPGKKLQEDQLSLDRAASLPLQTVGSVKDSIKYNSLNTKRKTKKPPALVVVDHDELNSGNDTLKKDSKKKKRQSRDDLDMPSDPNEHHAGSEDEGSPRRMGSLRKMKKSKSLRLAKDKSKGEKPQKISKDLKKMQEWEKKKKRQSQKPSYNYFTKDLHTICEDGKLCPRFVEKCIEFVEEFGMTTEGIYRKSGIKKDVELVLSRFESDKNVSLQELGVSVHAVTGAFKEFFKLLPDPLVPQEFYQKVLDTMIIMNADERISELKKVLLQFPEHSLAVFKKMMLHLQKVSEQQSSLQANQMNARNLAVVFSPTLMRPDFTLPLVMNPTGGPGGGIHPQNINAQNMNEIMFLRTCIEQYQLLFDDDEQKKNIAEAIVD